MSEEKLRYLINKYKGKEAVQNQNPHLSITRWISKKAL